MADGTVTRRQVESYSLHVGRNFGILTVVALGLQSQGLTATLVGTHHTFRVAFGVSFAALAAVVQLTALIYVFQMEKRNRRDGNGAPLLALVVSAAIFVAVALFVGLTYGLEVK